MAAPTSVRVESNSITTATLRWTYPGASTISVFRSLDGITYAEITIAETRVAVGTTIYTDTGLSPGTKYWYKLSDDAGSTFSSVVTVVVQVCGVPPSNDASQILPRAGDTVDPTTFNDLSQRVETGLVRFTDVSGRVCIACVTDGALAIDCVTYANCDTVQVVVNEDINSISMPNCDNTIQQVDFIIPPNTTRRICGFPAGSGFGGDECTQAPVSGGATGNIMSVPTSGNKADPNKTKSQPGSGGGGAGGGSACTCVPQIVEGAAVLTIKSCTAGNSLGCHGTKSLTLKACGGRTPYTWSHTGSVQLSVALGTSTTVTPPANSGSATAGTAYHLYAKFAFSDAGACTQTLIDRTYGCDDVLIGCSSDTCSGFAPTCNNTFPAGCNALPCVTCTRGVSGCTGTGGSTPCTPITPYCLDTTCVGKGEGGNVCDVRTAPMISAGCTPCGLSTGSTVSVTDALGTVATIVLGA